MVYDSTWLCCGCNTEDESLTHIFSCSKWIYTLKLIQDKVYSSFYRKLQNKYVTDDNDKRMGKKFGSSLPIWTSITSSDPEQLTFAHFIRGFIPYDLVTEVTKYTKKRSDAIQEVAFMQYSVRKLFHQQVWITRNQLQAAEETRRHVTQKQKTKYTCTSSTSINVNVMRKYHDDGFSISSPPSSWIKQSIQVGPSWEDFHLATNRVFHILVAFLT